MSETSTLNWAYKLLRFEVTIPMKLNPYEIQNISKKILKLFGEIPVEALAAIEKWGLESCASTISCQKVRFFPFLS